MIQSENETIGSAKPQLQIADAGPLAKLGARVRSVFGGRELWAVADQALVSGTNFLTNVIIARSLGITNFGIFALAWMAVLFFSSMQMATIVAPMMSLGPKTSTEDRPGYFGAVLVQEIIFTIICTIILLAGLSGLAAYNHQPALKGLAFPLCVAMLSYLLQDFARRYLFTTKQSFRAFLNDAISCLPQLPLIFVLTRAHVVGLPGVLWLIAITSFVGVGLGIYWLEPITITTKTIVATTKQHWRISRWLSPSALLWWTSTNFFVLAAPAYYGAMAAGVLRACNNMVGVSHIWFLGLDNVIPAETARLLHKKGIGAATSYLKEMTIRWGLITAAFVAVLSVAPGLWLGTIYGRQYAPYGDVLRIYGFFYLLVFSGRILGAGLQALEYTAPTFWSYLLLTALSIVLAAPLTKHLGLRGVIVGMIMTQAISQSILVIFFIRRVRLIRRTYDSGPALSAAIS